jgi:hypothetical protein
MADELTPAQIQQAEKNAADDGFLHRVAVAADQDLNVDSGGLPDETISSRVRRVCDTHPRWSWNPGVWFAKTINAGLNLLQNDHGQRAQSGDLERAMKVVGTERAALGLADSQPQIAAANTVDPNAAEFGNSALDTDADRGNRE